MTVRKPASGGSLHHKILSEAQNKILSGEWAVGTRIPVEHELMKQYKCSRMTVSKVLTQLTHAGLIERKRKAGSFVRRPSSQSAVMHIADIKTEVAALGLPYRFELLHREKRRGSPEELGRFETRGGLQLVELVCRHFAGSQPFCIEHRLINLQAVPDAVDEPFVDEAPGAWLLRRVPWMLAEHRIRAVTSARSTLTQLKLKPGTACLVVERITRSKFNVITFVTLTYPGKLHELVASFTPLSAAPTNLSTLDLPRKRP